MKRKRHGYASKHVLISLFDCHCPCGSFILVPDLPCLWCTSSCGRARGSGHLHQLWRLLHVLWGGDLLLREQHTMLVTLFPCQHHVSMYLKVISTSPDVKILKIFISYSNFNVFIIEFVNKISSSSIAKTMFSLQRINNQPERHYMITNCRMYVLAPTTRWVLVPS